jgi:adenylate cyclase
VDFLQEVYEKLGGIIVEHNGEIIKYMGDGIFSIFPSGSGNETVECAFQMREVFPGIVKKRKLPADTELEIGISSGPLRIGTFGHRSLRQKDAMGEAVTWAATIGHHRGIAITEAVYHQIKEHYATNRLPDVTLKWQDEPLRVWEVLAEN